MPSPSGWDFSRSPEVRRESSDRDRRQQERCHRCAPCRPAQRAMRRLSSNRTQLMLDQAAIAAARRSTACWRWVANCLRCASRIRPARHQRPAPAARFLHFLATARRLARTLGAAAAGSAHARAGKALTRARGRGNTRAALKGRERWSWRAPAPAPLLAATLTRARAPPLRPSRVPGARGAASARGRPRGRRGAEAAAARPAAAAAFRRPSLGRAAPRLCAGP